MYEVEKRTVLYKPRCQSKVIGLNYDNIFWMWREVGSLLLYKEGTGIGQLVYWLTTGLTARGSNPGRGKGFSLLQNRPDQLWGLPSLLFNSYRDFFLVVKWLVLEVDRWRHLVLRFRMSGALLFLPLYASEAWTGTALLFNLLYD
jgi:hypothetical protein